MKKQALPSSPDEYTASLSSWQREYVDALRAATLGADPELHEVIKWGHLVYFSNGPVLLIRAEVSRVLFGFWRGARMQEIEPRLKRGGKYEMATLELNQTTPLARSSVTRLVTAAVALNAKLGDPTAIAAMRG